jgi:hypothetical protein
MALPPALSRFWNLGNGIWDRDAPGVCIRCAESLQSNAMQLTHLSLILRRDINSTLRNILCNIEQFQESYHIIPIREGIAS